MLPTKQTQVKSILKNKGQTSLETKDKNKTLKV